MASEADYTAKSSEPLASYDRDTYSWKTPQRLLTGDLEPFAGTFPIAGMMRDGCLWQLPTWERPTSYESVGGVLPKGPTLTVCGNYNRKGASATSGEDLMEWLERMPTLCARDHRYPGRSRLERTGELAGDPLPQVIGGPLNPAWAEWYMGFPIGFTASRDWVTRKSHCKPQQHGESLNDSPTPPNDAT